MTPYLASVSWYAHWLKARLDGLSGDEASIEANKGTNVSSKDFARCRIKGQSNPTLLTLPVEGGSSRLKRTSGIPRLKLSEHGNWRHSHMGALNAAYGRSPYFQHFMPILADVYNSGESSLKDFNERIHSAVVEMLFGDMDQTTAPLSIRDAAKERGKEIASGINPDISVIDLLMTHGRESLLPLLSLSTSKLLTLNS